MRHFPFSIFALTSIPGIGRAGDIGAAIGPFDMYDVDEGIASLGIRIDVPLPKDICLDGALGLTIRRSADLKPQSLVRCSEYLSDVVGALELVRANRADPEATAVGLQQRFGRLPLDLSVLTTETAPEADGSLLDAILSKVDLSITSSAPAKPSLTTQLEEMLKTALSCVYRDPDFRRLESALRGIDMLVRQGGVKKSNRTAVTICPTDRETLESTLRDIVRRSGERPPSLVLVDLPFDNSFAAVDALETVANFSEAVSVPSVVHLSPAFFGRGGWDELAAVGYLAHEVATQPYAKFKAFSEAPAARWLTLALPEICVRNPYGKAASVRPVAVDETDEVWVSPVWAVGAVAVQSQTRFGWATRLTDFGACRIEQAVIPKHTGRRTPLASQLSADRLQQLHEIGMAPLMGEAEQEHLFLTKAPTLARSTLGFQLFASRVIGFFYDQRSTIGEEIRTPDALTAHLHSAFAEKWAETGQPAPEDTVIGVAHDDGRGQVILSVRVTPPTELVPERRMLEFEISFAV